jgi:hypothetical protein
VSGTVAVSNTGFNVNNFPATQDVSGNVTVNTISGFAVESGGNLASIKTNTDKIKSDTTNADAIQVQVKNSSIAVTGSFYQEIQPVSGTVAISNTGFDVNNFPASTNSHTQAYDPSGGGGYFDITSTSISATVSALDVAVKNTVPVTGSFYQETQPVSGDVSITNTSLDTHCYASSNGTTWHHLKSDANGILNIHSMTQDGAGTDITSTLNGAKQSLDVNVANTVAVTGSFYQETQPVSIDTSSPIPVTGDITIDNGSTTNFDSATGINVYQILPKIKQYTIGGFDEQNSTYRLFGLATGGGINTTTTDFGLANPRVHYGGTSGGTADRVAFIDYVNSSGNLVENAGPYTFNNSTYATLPSMIAPIKFRLTSNLAAGQAVYISIAANSSVGAVAGQDQNQYCIGTFTVPNGYIGYISHLSSTVGGATNIQIVKWDVNGIRSVVYRFNNTGIANQTAGYEGALGGIFYAGETVAFSNQTAVASKSCFANMILKSIL